MDDKEVRAWLAADELALLERARSDGIYVVLLERLAETRKALRLCEEDGAIITQNAICRLCRQCTWPTDDLSSEETVHAPTCIFTTMPRPK